MNHKKVQEIELILDCEITSSRRLSGGSGDNIFLLKTSKNRKYVYKSGAVNSISPQAFFYKEYSELPYLPRLIYSKPDELIIDYLDLKKLRENYSKIEILEILTESFLSKYKIISQTERFGFLSGFLTAKSFADFIIKQSQEAYKYISDIFQVDELNSLVDLIKIRYSHDYFSTKYLIHGDFGFHNIFYTFDKPLGIIDPDPIIGHPLYDLLFAFCSTPEQINPKNYDTCLSRFLKIFPINLDRKSDFLKISLFKRISSCRKHHPEDLQSYLQIWRDINNFE